MALYNYKRKEGSVKIILMFTLDDDDDFKVVLLEVTHKMAVRCLPTILSVHLVKQMRTVDSVSPHKNII